MRCFTRARKQVKARTTHCRTMLGNGACLRPRVWRLRLVLAFACVVTWAASARAQDSGSKEREFFGNGAEIAVTVRDGSGEPISAPTMVRLTRDGTISSGQGATSQGRMSFIVTSLGEFTVVVEAAGYPRTEKDVSVRAPGRTPVDIYLRRMPGTENTVGVPGKPLLAPKAKEAFDRGLRALGADRLPDAQRFVSEAARLAPGHPDVLYAQGILYLRQGNWEQAQTALEKATQVDPNHARAFAALGMALSDQRKYEAAIAPLEQAKQLDAAGVGYEADWALAKAYYQCARYEEALEGARAAQVESKGKAPEIGLLVAQSLTAVGRYEDAASVLREFLRDHQDRPEAPKARRWLEALRISGKIGPD
jgi:Flp pilus assembly protein TadD